MSNKTINKADATTLNDVVAREGATKSASAIAQSVATAQRASASPRKTKTKAAQRKAPINATSHVYERRGVIYIYARRNDKTYRFTTGKEATKENYEWAFANWQTFLQKMIRKKEAKQAAKRKAEREAIKARSTSTSLSILSSGDPLCIAIYGAQAIKNGAYLRKSGTNDKYNYVFRSRIVPVFGALRVDEVKPSHVREWQSNLANEGLSTSTIKQYRSILNASFTAAIADEIVDRNPVSIVKAPKLQPKERSPFTMDEISRLLCLAKDGWFRDYLIIAFFTGLRIGEAFALEWRHIDFKDKIICVTQAISGGVIGTPKTPSSIRTIDMLPIVEQALSRQFERTGRLNSFVFLNRFNRVFKSWTNIRKKLWKPLLEQCGLKYRVLYSTRHTYASIMLSQSEEPMWVSAMLGHKDLSITLSVYAQYLPRREVKRAAFLDDFSVTSEVKNDQERANLIGDQALVATNRNFAQNCLF
jgi:integrase